MNLFKAIIVLGPARKSCNKSIYLEIIFILEFFPLIVFRKFSFSYHKLRTDYIKELNSNVHLL